MDNEKDMESLIISAILEGSSDGIAILSDAGTIENLNDLFKMIFNLDSNNLSGISIYRIMPGLDFGNEEFINYEIKGSKKVVGVRKKVISNGNSNLSILIVSENSFNLNLIKKYHDMKIQKDIYESVLNSIDEGIHVADKDGKLIFINPTQEKLDNLVAKDVLGKHWLDIYDLDEKSSLVLKVLDSGIPELNSSQRYVTRKGTIVNIICSCIPLYNEGELIGSAAISKDYIKYKEIAEKILSFKEDIPTIKKASSKLPKKEKHYSFEDILGENKMIRDNISWGKRAAKSNSSVLIYGETGTGKELFAQSIHSSSNRSNETFLAINCAAIPENLLEGLLFGTAKGAFTGAVDRTGLIEQTNGGTLFLDEINSMDISLQSKLLRIIEEKKVMRLGGKSEVDVDVRFICSCNTEPLEAIEKGHFRSDLFYRLAVIYIDIPPLRKRLDDLNLLVEHFIHHYNAVLNKKVIGISSEVMKVFNSYDWPGNIRQLKHSIECAMNIVDNTDNRIEYDHLPKYLKSSIPVRKEPVRYIEANNLNIIESIKETEKVKIIEALKKNKANVAKAASDLGMTRQQLHYRIKKYNLK